MTLKHSNIHFTDHGHGKPIIFLHGFLETSSIWKPIITEFTTTHRVICIDLLGHGKTDSPNEIHTMELHAQAVKTVIDHLKITTTTIIGHSMGGYVALALIETQPHLANGLCLINSTSKEDSIQRKKSRDRVSELVEKNYKTYVSMAISNLFNAATKNLFLNAIERLKLEALAMNPKSIIASNLGMKNRKNRTDVLKNYTSKKLILIGEKDPILNANALIEECKETQTDYVILPNGHMSYIEDEKELKTSLKKFLQH